MAVGCECLQASDVASLHASDCASLHASVTVQACMQWHASAERIRRKNALPYGSTVPNNVYSQLDFSIKKSVQACMQAPVRVTVQACKYRASTCKCRTSSTKKCSTPRPYQKGGQQHPITYIHFMFSIQVSVQACKQLPEIACKLHASSCETVAIHGKRKGRETVRSLLPSCRCRCVLDAHFEGTLELPLDLDLQLSDLITAKTYGCRLVGRLYISRRLATTVTGLSNTVTRSGANDPTMLVFSFEGKACLILS